MIALMTVCLFFEILVQVLNIASAKARAKTLFGHLNLTQHVQKPTRITPTSETLIDHIVSNNPKSVTLILMFHHVQTLAIMMARMPA